LSLSRKTTLAKIEEEVMKKLMVLIASAVLFSACYQETTGELHGDATIDTIAPDGAVEICDNGVDDDGNGLADCGDPACASECPDASTDADPDGDDDAPPVEICDNGVDDDGNGLADCGDPACADVCPDGDASEDAIEDPIPDAAEDSVADIPVDTAEDPSEDSVIDTSLDTSVDTGSDADTDTSVDTGTEEIPCVESPGEIVLTWSVPGTVYQELRAECWVRGTVPTTPPSYSTLDSWSSTWEDVIDWIATPSATPSDAWARSTYHVSHRLSYAPGVEAWCNFTAFNVVSGLKSGQVYALGVWPPGSGTCDVTGTLTAISGTCDVTSDVSAILVSSGSSCNYHVILP